MNTVSPLLIVSFSLEEVENLTELAKSLGYSDAQVVAGPVASAIKALDARASAPEYIIIDIGKREKDVLPELDEFALHCEPTVLAVVIGDINDITFYRELKQRGILEYFPRPVQPADISTALRHASNAQQRSKNSGLGSVISCMSAASGDGSSTLAVNLAWCFANEHKQSTVLMDMDYQFGLSAKNLDVTAPFGTRELFEHPDRGLDNVLVEKMLAKYGERLNIISSPGELRLMPDIRPEVVKELLDILRTRFKYIVIELPHVWTDWTAAVLKNSDHIMLVGQLWLRSLTHATRLLTAWQAAGIERSNVSLIMNRSGAKFKEAISAEEFERICHQKIEGHLNNEIKTIVSAENQGKTIMETANGSLLEQQFKQIAQEMVTRFSADAAEQSTPAAAPAKKGLKGLFEKKSGT